MCLLVFAWRAWPDHRLVLAANRDEAHRRPAAPAAFWNDAPQLLAGRDLEAGGTWLGLTTHGRIAALTNIRERASTPAGAPSRGTLVSEFLLGDDTPEHFLTRLRDDGTAYAGFNLIFGDLDGLYYFANRGERSGALAPGVYALSNHLLDTPWHKVQRVRERFERLRAHGTGPDPEALFALLRDTTPAPDAELPDTALPRDVERSVSAPFVIGQTYGTRSSTCVLIDNEAHATFAERSFDTAGENTGTQRFEIDLQE